MNILKSLFGSSGASLTAAEAKSRLDTDHSLFVLDVRQPEEFRAGHIAGATLVPLDQLGAVAQQAAAGSRNPLRLSVRFAQQRSGAPA